MAKFFYRGESNTRKNSIMKWFKEDDNRQETITNLTTYLKDNSLTDFENQLSTHIEPAFLYIVEEGQTQDFALRLIRNLNISVKVKKEEREEIIRRQKTGTIKGKRVHIKQYTSIKIGKKVIFRARDNRGRFVKVSS